MTESHNANVTLTSLVEFCLKKRTSPVIFQSLLKQIHHKQEITNQDIINLLSTANEFDPLLLVYLTTSTLRETSTTLKISSLLFSLQSATASNQTLLLTTYVSQIRSLPDEALPLNTFEVQDLISSVIFYLKYLLESQDGLSQLTVLADFALNLLDKLPREANLTLLLSEHNEILAQFINNLKDSESQISEELELNLNKLMKKTSISGSLALSGSSQTSSAQHLSFVKSNKSAKIIWLNNAIQTWSTHRSNFIQSFEQCVKIKTNQNVLNDLIATSFECYILALNLNDVNSIIVKNWRLFLIKRLPLLIKQLNLKNFESSLINALNLVDSKVTQTIKEATTTDHHPNSNSSNNGNNDSNFDDMFDSFPSTVTDIRHDILRSCIALNLLPQSSFQTILKQDANADNRPLLNNDDVIDESGAVIDLNDTLKRTLIDINIEFVSLEESELLNFLQLVPKMAGSKQVEISKLILSTIEQFIKERDFLHLYRLSLGLSSTPEALHVVIFHISPLELLGPLFKVIDQWQSNTDDDNFQETYTSFSCIFLLALYIIKQFNITLEQLVTLKQPGVESFILKYITGIGKSVKFDKFTEHQLKLFNDWKTALFETGEGISDDLIRSSSIQECYEILPIIFQQVFVAYKQNFLDLESVKGGLEYFLQPFLLPTVIGIFAWCENNLWKFQDVDVVTTFLKIFINPADISGEAFFIHKAVLGIYGPNLLKALKVIDSSIVSPAVGGGGFDIDSTLLSTLESSISQSIAGADEVKILKFLEFDSSNLITNTPQSPSLGTLFINEFHVLLDPSQQHHHIHSNLYDPRLLSTLLKLQGPVTFIKLLLSEINKAQIRAQSSGSNTGKLNTMNVIELSCLLITLTYIHTNHHKSLFLKSLKSNTIEGATDASFRDATRFLKSWSMFRDEIKHKEECIEGEIFKVLGERLIETVDFYIPLE